jgi:SAM-dependent methyltransferase
MKRIIFSALFLLPITASVFPVDSSMRAAQDVFTEIYAKKLWGANEYGVGWSGAGSDFGSTPVYRKFLQDFLAAYAIKSVVDVGCGDWEFSRYIDWKGIDYLGVDVVEAVLIKDKIVFGTETIRFKKMDVLQEELPKADLLICKDVLQHLTNEDVCKVIKQFSNYKYCLITNDVNADTCSSDNPQVIRGDYRPIDLTKEPFNVVGQKVLTYKAYYVTKQVLLIVNE